MSVAPKSADKVRQEHPPPASRHLGVDKVTLTFRKASGFLFGTLNVRSSIQKHFCSISSIKGNAVGVDQVHTRSPLFVCARFGFSFRGRVGVVWLTSNSALRVL